jgi:hypothetical protein
MTEYTLGDLIVIVLGKNISYNQVMGIYKSYDPESDQVTIYPVTSEGLQIAKFDAGETQELLHRELAFTVSNYSKANTFIIDTPNITLDSSQKYYYDQIQSRLRGI